MIKLMALYKKPADETAFIDHYIEVHVPLIRAIPGMERFVINKVTEAPLGGEPPYFLIAEMQFADEETYKAAMKSDENKAAGKDLMEFAKDSVTLLVTRAQAQ